MSNLDVQFELLPQSTTWNLDLLKFTVKNPIFDYKIFEKYLGWGPVFGSGPQKGKNV